MRNCATIVLDSAASGSKTSTSDHSAMPYRALGFGIYIYVVIKLIN